MPRGRPATSARKTSAGRQNTLSFAGKPTKVTKPGQQTTTLGKNAEAKAQKLLSEQPTQVSIATPSVSGDETISIDTKSAETKAQDAKIENELTTAELAFRDQTQAEHVERTPEEEQASKISDTQIKKYWKAKEDARIYPRVHQEGMSLHEKVLREFDLSSHFGPCIGVARTKRWKRAHKLGLNPPIEVLAVLLKEDAKTNPKVQRAYIDELMASKTTVETEGLV